MLSHEIQNEFNDVFCRLSLILIIILFIILSIVFKIIDIYNVSYNIYKIAIFN